MKCADITQLNWLFGLILVSLFFVWIVRKRKYIIKGLVSKQLRDEMLVGYHSSIWLVKYLLILNVLALSILALARPQWGFQWQEVKRQGVDILIVIDTSKSMLTEDVKPNRLERTKLAVKDLLKNLKGDRVGLMAFAGDAFMVCPLTIDYQGFLLSLNDLNINTISRGGTNIARAIEEAMRAYKDTTGKYKAVIIMTDGDNLEGDPEAIAQLAKRKGLKLYTIGIGTREGELIQIMNQVGRREFLKDRDGNFIKSRLNELLLKKIALMTGGVYVKAGAARFGLDVLYDKYISRLEKKEFESLQEKRYHERFQIPLFLALMLLVIETCLPFYRKV